MNVKNLFCSVVALALLGVGVPAVAPADTQEGVINACVDKKGRLRIVEDAVCNSKETLLVWNVTGLQGANPRFVGFTVATFDGGQGVITYTNACSQEIAGSHMCTSADVINTKEYPSALSSNTLGWVKPSFMPISGPGDGRISLDISGLASTRSDGASNTCGGWGVAGSSNRGLTVDDKGRFKPIHCNTVQSVACCK